MFARAPLLTLQQGRDGSFAGWLKDLGLEQFAKTYGLRNIVEWGWLVPQSRVLFPHQFFHEWLNFPNLGQGTRPELETVSLLWDSTWLVDDTESPDWFLHPFFHVGDKAGAILQSGADIRQVNIPPSFRHARGFEITPYADYFYPWQGYALVDVIRHADCITPIINTPDVIAKTERLVEIARRVSTDASAEVLQRESQWGGLAKLMTWLAHYKSFRDALYSLELRNPGDYSVRKLGAIALASHFGITAEALHEGIESRLLVLASNWKWASDTGCKWTVIPYELLRGDILVAVEWLCYLTGKRREHYLKEWQHTDRGIERWAELAAVLPFESFINRNRFLELMPHYLMQANAALNGPDRLEGVRLQNIVDALRENNYPFSSFIGAFRDMHDELSYHQKPNKELDFRELRPLDGYLVLAIRAEAVFRYALEVSGDLQNIPSAKHGLEAYIEYLASKRGLSAPAIQMFTNSVRLTRLRNANGANPVTPLQQLQTNLGTAEDYLVKSFLCGVLARNYFAHHYFFDRDLWRSPDSGFLISGLLTTVIWLLE